MSISQFLVHALVEIRVLRSRAVSASRSHQYQGYKPHQYPNSPCTQSLKSVPCGVELSPHRDHTNFMDTNRINIPMPDDCISACAFAQEVVHAIVEIHVLAESHRLRIEPSVSGVQAASISQVEGRVQQSERAQPLCGVLPRRRLRSGRCRARLKINGKAMRAV